MKQYDEGLYIVEARIGENDFKIMYAVQLEEQNRAEVRSSFFPIPDGKYEKRDEENYSWFSQIIKDYKICHPESPIIFDNIDPDINELLRESRFKDNTTIVGRIPREVQAELERRLQ